MQYYNYRAIVMKHLLLVLATISLHAQTSMLLLDAKAPAAGPVVYVTHGANQSTDNNTATISGITTTGANFIFIGCSGFGVACATPTDSVTSPTCNSPCNTWQALGDYTVASFHVQGYYCVSCTVGTGHAFAESDTGAFPGLCMEAFSGVKSSSPQ